MAAVGLVVGVPLGIGIGSGIHTSIANSLGVVPAVATPSLIGLAVVAGVLAVANLSAIAPARRAARARGGTILERGGHRRHVEPLRQLCGAHALRPLPPGYRQVDAVRHSS